MGDVDVIIRAAGGSGRSALVVALVTLAALVVAPTAGRAQTGMIAGAVWEAGSGTPLEGVTVVLRGTPLRTVTDARGQFTIGHLEAGRYTLLVAAIGFARDSQPDILLGDGERRVVRLVLRPEALLLPEFVVTGTRGAERSDEAMASISVLPAHELVRRNVTTLDQALVYVPGVTFNGSNQLDIRGAAGFARGIGSRVLMLLDGHPILSGDGGEIDFVSIPLLDLEQAEIVKGAYSAVYGSNALGGVVNLITAPVSSTPETVVRAHADAYTYPSEYSWADGMQGAFGFGLQHSRRLGSVGVRTFIGHERTDGYKENGDSRRWIGRVKLASSADADRPWDVYGVFSRERAGEFFTWRSQDEPYRVPLAFVGDHTFEHRLLTGATITPRARASHLVKLSPYFNVTRIENDFTDNDDWHTAVKPGLTAEVAWYAGDRHAIRLGVDGAHTWVTSNFLGAPKMRDMAAFAQDEIQLTRRLKGSLGVRLDHHKANLGVAEWAVSPKIGASLRVGSGTTLRTSVGAGYRAPSAIEQFVSSQQFGFRVIPNPDLIGEHAWSAELGATVRILDEVRVDAAVFGSLYRDLISPAPAPGQTFVFQFGNVSRARVAGLDVGLHAQIVPSLLDVQATYLLLDTEDRATGSPLPYRSQHNVTGTLNLLGGLAGVDLRYRSRVEGVLAYPLDPRSDVTVVDLRVGYRALNVLWQLKVANVFNQFYVDVQERNPGAPRSIAITALRGL
jgi:iron complex outermembrane receptor protein